MMTEQENQLICRVEGDAAMGQLGVGKNMVRSIRFWAESSGVIEHSEDGHAPWSLPIAESLEPRQ